MKLKIINFIWSLILHNFASKNSFVAQAQSSPNFRHPQQDIPGYISEQPLKPDNKQFKS